MKPDSENFIQKLDTWARDNSTYYVCSYRPETNDYIVAIEGEPPFEKVLIKATTDFDELIKLWEEKLNSKNKDTVNNNDFKEKV